MTQQTASTSGEIRAETGGFVNTGIININLGGTRDSAQPSEHLKNILYGLPAANKAFVDRLDIIAQMKSALGEMSLSNECGILALQGLGGMGKTQLMLRYCYLHCAKYTFVSWLTVDGWSTAVDSFRKLAIKLGFQASTTENDTDEAIFSWVRERLDVNTNWLILLDNADSSVVKDIFTHLPRFGGHIILTTREHIPPRKAKVIHVDKMSDDEALSLLMDGSADRDMDHAQKIVKELDGMPLALNLARAYIDNTLISFKEYLIEFKTKCSTLLSYSDEDSSYQYAHTIATVWSLSFERLRTTNPVTVQILEACAFLQPDAIPTRLFEKQYSALQLSPLLSNSLASEADSEQARKAVREAIAVLVKYSFVMHTWTEVEADGEDPAHDVLRIHRLVQAVIRSNIGHSQWEERLVVALDKEVVSSNFYSAQVRTINEAYIPHIHQVLNHVDWSQMNKDHQFILRELLIRTAEYLWRGGIYRTGLNLAQTAKTISENIFGPVSQETALSLNQLALLYKNQGMYKEAETLYQQALAIREKVLGPDHTATATSLNNLASLYKNQGKYKEAEPLYQRALAIFEKALGPDHPDTATSVNDLAALYVNQGKYKEAEPLYQRAIMIDEKVYGPDHPDTANTLNNLAGLYKNQGKYKEAEPLYQQALAIKEKALGPDHPDTATSVNDLAALYVHQGKYKEAEPLYQRAIMIDEKVYGPDHPDTAKTLNNLAGLYKNQGKYKEAEPLYQRALTIAEENLGPNHPQTAGSLNNLAALYTNQGKYKEAEPLYQRALAIKEKALGPDHPDTATSVNDLAGLYNNQGKYKEAEPLYQQALVTYEKALGFDHPFTATSVNNLAGLYKNQGKYKEAEPLYQRALAIREKSLGPDHPNTASSLNNLAGLYFNQGKYKEAEPLYQRALAIKEKALGPDHPSTLITISNLAGCCDNKGKYTEAEKTLELNYPTTKQQCFLQ